MNKILLELENRRSEAKKGGGKRTYFIPTQKRKINSKRKNRNTLVDPGSFEEFDMFVTHRCTDFDLDKNLIPGDGVITGWATVNNQLIYFV